MALRPLRTWNGEGASGEGMRQGPEGEPSSWGVSAGPWRQQVTGWPGGGLVGGKTTVTWKTKQMGRKRRIPSQGTGAAGGTAPGPTWPGGQAVGGAAEDDHGPRGRGGKRMGWGRLRAFIPGRLQGWGIGPQLPSTECQSTNEMEETRTAGGMMWPASHCPLLGRVVPSSADVSSGAKARRERETGRGNLTFLCSPGRALPALMRLPDLERGLGRQDLDN